MERSQGTGRRWAKPHTCVTIAQLQQRLEEMDQIQRQEYPSIGCQSRQSAFPGLTHSGRRYSLAWERRSWELVRVAEHLSGYVVSRRVDIKGQVSLYNRTRYVGKASAGQDVLVTFDPVDHRWVASAVGGTQLRTWPAEEITREQIVRLEVSHRR